MKVTPSISGKGMPLMFKHKHRLSKPQKELSMKNAIGRERLCMLPQVETGYPSGATPSNHDDGGEEMTKSAGGL